MERAAFSMKNYLVYYGRQRYKKLDFTMNALSKIFETCAAKIQILCENSKILSVFCVKWSNNVR